MAKIKIRYNGKYYEYDNKELNVAIYYESTPRELITLFEKRANHIKDLNMATDVLKYKKDNDIGYYGSLCERSIKMIHEIEEEIALTQNKLGCSLDWYSPTNPLNEQDVPVLEEQKKYICTQCGYELDPGYTYTYEDHGITLEEFFEYKCPNCKSERSFYSRNQYLMRAEILREKANSFFQKNNYTEGIELLDKACLELEKVNLNDEDDYLNALYDIALVKQTMARAYVSMELYEKALACINEALSLWDKAMENNAVYDLNIVAMGYYVRQCCCLELNKNLESALEDGERALKLLNRYKELIDATHDDDHFKNYEKCCNEYEGISMIIYITKQDVLHALHRSQEEIERAYREGKQFLNQCTHLDADERNDFNYQLSKYITQNRTPASSTKKEGCYIATAVYGDYNAQPVLVLREFRDQILMNSIIGRAFIKVYYRYSPAFAEKLKGYPHINKVVKHMLDAYVRHLQKRKGY